MHLATIKWFATALLYLSATQLIKDNGFQATGVMVILMIAVDLCFVAGIGLIFDIVFTWWFETNLWWLRSYD